METHECQLIQSGNITSSYQGKPTSHTQYKSGETISIICIKSAKSDDAQVPEWLWDKEVLKVAEFSMSPGYKLIVMRGIQALRRVLLRYWKKKNHFELCQVV